MRTTASIHPRKFLVRDPKGTVYHIYSIGLLCQLLLSETRLLTPFRGPNPVHFKAVAYPGIFFEGASTNSVEDRGQREWGSGGGNPLVRGSGGSCNLVQEISFHIVI
jgi:hypothetical protein